MFLFRTNRTDRPTPAAAPAADPTPAPEMSDGPDVADLLATNLVQAEEIRTLTQTVEQLQTTVAALRVENRSLHRELADTEDRTHAYPPAQAPRFPADAQHTIDELRRTLQGLQDRLDLAEGRAPLVRLGMPS